jgi:hypothetical protein
MNAIRETAIKGELFALAVTVTDTNPTADYSGEVVACTLRHGVCEFTYTFTPVAIPGPGVPQTVILSAPTGTWPVGVLSGAVQVAGLVVARLEVVVCPEP